MIVVTQGHEKGIGLEVFFKVLILGPSVWTNQCLLVADKKTVSNYLKKLNIPGTVLTDRIELPSGNLKVNWLPSSKLPLSTISMIDALQIVQSVPGRVLFTLPTTKDDLRNPKKPNQRYLGHTEFLRAEFKSDWLGMYFNSFFDDTLLLTDHVALKSVITQLTPSLFSRKLSLSLKYLKLLEPRLTRAYVAGLNPHFGESGLLGKEELRLKASLDKICVKGFKVDGFYSGDTLHVQKRSSEDLLIYPYHDQGLAPFKALNGSIGANITLGLPFVRLSVDHGTAFQLYGKNIADYRGAHYCLRKAMSYQELDFGKNSDHKG